MFSAQVRNAATGTAGVTAMGIVSDQSEACILTVDQSQGRELMVVGGGDGGVRLWSLPRFSHPKMIKSVREHRGGVTSVSLSGDTGEFVLTSASDGAAILWRLADMTRAHILQAGSGTRASWKLTPLAFSKSLFVTLSPIRHYFWKSSGK